MMSKKFGYVVVSIIFSLLCAMIVAGCGSSGTPKQKHIYDTAKVVDLKNGAGTANIGKVSVLKIKSSDLTQAALEDWYFNYASKNVGANGEKWNWAVIVYTDRDNYGTFYNGTLIKDVKIKKEAKDDTWVLDSDQGQILVPDKGNQHLTSMEEAKVAQKKEQEAMLAKTSSKDIEVQMSHQVEKIGENKYKVSGTTNLPEGTQLMIKLSSDSYRGSGKREVQNSAFEVVFSGEKLVPGEYSLSITMPLVKVQKNPSLTEKLGDNGEHLKGQYAVPANIGNNIIVRYEVDVSLD